MTHPALKVVCGVCGALPEQECVTPSGEPRKALHSVRSAAAKRAKTGASAHSVPSKEA